MSDIMIVFAIAVLGYLLGSIKVKGLQLGTSGILLVALVFGHFGFLVPDILKDLGLVSFVTAVGFIAGPGFFRNFKKKALGYIALGIAIILAGGIACIGVIKLAAIPEDLAVGMMSGALTSTPGLAAAIEATGSDMASVGYGIAYPFGVIGVVLFVQLLPKILRVDMEAERQRLVNAHQEHVPDKKENKRSFTHLDEFGLLPFAVAAILGILIGKIQVPMSLGDIQALLHGEKYHGFSLGTSGGPLLAGLIMGHFAHIGPIAIDVPKKTLDECRELGLDLFLMGAGTNAGQRFVAVLSEYGVSLFLLGAVMTLIPMVVGFFLARKVFKIDIFNSLGAICGGMTSTPALGTLISSTKTEAVAVSYAATYPVALILVVLCCEFIPMLV